MSEELNRESWADYLTQLSRGHPEIEIRVEILGGDVGHGIEAESLRFEDAVYDERNDVFEISGSVQVGGSRQVLRHFVSNPQQIWVERRAGLPNAVEVVGADGVKTLVTIAAASPSA